MNNNDHERNIRWQQAAEQAERSGAPAGDPDIDAYRLVIRAVRQAAMPVTPADFAVRVALRLHRSPERAGVEDGIVILLLLGMALGGGGYLMPRLWPMLSALPIALPHLSWHWIIAAAAGLALAWAIDRYWDQQTGGMPA